ncbi:MAG TPA: APC family permease [Blastocatellia bacterium]|nr:APC family permease [Blastocatellia bacterium]
MPKKQLTLIPLIGIIYFTVSGGAFGLENVISGAGPGLGLLLLIITPLMWSLPTTLVTAEMATMLPLEGGYYRWVYFGMGRFWGFLEGWWTWLYTFVDMAIYPVTFSIYLKFFFPGMTWWQQWLVNLLVIGSSLAINWRGAKSVGNSAVIAFVVVTAAFLLLTILAIPKMTHTPWHPFTPAEGKPLSETLGIGLTAVMWSYMGWDNVSTFAGEVKHPGRTFPLALLISVLLVTLLYVLPMTATLSATTSWQTWDSDNFTISQVASQLVAPWLGALISFGVMWSNWSLFNSQLLYTSRLPFAMAEDGLLPQALTKTHPRFGTPVISLLVCAAIYSVFTLLSFKKLVVINVLIYTMSLLLEFAALIRLRFTRPDLERPFKIPGGMPGVLMALFSLLLFALACIVFTITGEDDSWQQIILVIGLLLTGPLVYSILKWRRNQPGELSWLQALSTTEK